MDTPSDAVTLQRLAEKAFVVLVLFFYTGGGTQLIALDNPIYVIVPIFRNLAFVITLVLIVARWRRVFSIALREVLLWGLVAIALCSALWSDYPPETFQEAIPLVQATLFGIYFSTAYSLRQQLQFLSAMFGFSALLTLFVCLAVPSYGIVGKGLIVNMESVVHEGAWRGIYSHRTMMASTMSLAGICFFFSALSRGRYQILQWAGLLLSTFLILQSRATAAFFILFICLSLVFLYRTLRVRFTVLIPLLTSLFMIVGSILTILMSNVEPILTSLGKEITISGRTDFWPNLFEKVWERPWFGYGYHAFWVGGWKGEPADIWKTLKYGFEPPHAHNGFLELLLSFGLVGFSVFALGYVVSLFRSITWLQSVRIAEGLLPITYLSFTVLINSTESLLLRPDIYWILYVSFILSMYNKTIHFYEVKRFWQRRGGSSKLILGIKSQLPQSTVNRLHSRKN